MAVLDVGHFGMTCPKIPHRLACGPVLKLPTVFATTCKLTNFAPVEAPGAGVACLADMGNLEYFEILKKHAVFRPAGQVSIERAIELVTAAIAFARARHVRNLLVDVSNLTGFEPPTIASRYFFVHEWAHASAGRVRVAFLIRPELIDPQKFSCTVAANAGFVADVFTTEEDALIWLQGV